MALREPRLLNDEDFENRFPKRNDDKKITGTYKSILLGAGFSSRIDENLTCTTFMEYISEKSDTDDNCRKLVNLARLFKTEDFEQILQNLLIVNKSLEAISSDKIDDEALNSIKKTKECVNTNYKDIRTKLLKF